MAACSRRRIFEATWSRNACIDSVFAWRKVVAIDHPVSGSTAANTQMDLRPFCRITLGREPVGAQTVLRVPCCPNLASSWKSTRTRVRGFAA